MKSLLIRQLTNIKFVRDAHWLVLSAVLAGAAGLALQAMVANMLSIAGLGLYALIVGIYSIVAAGSAIGLDTMVLRWSAGYLGNPHSPSATSQSELAHKIGGTLLIVLITSGGIAVCVLFTTWIWPEFSSSAEATVACLILLPATVLFSLNKVLVSVLMGLRQVLSFASVRVGRAAILIVVTSAVLLGDNASVMALLLAYPAAELLLFLYLFTRLYRSGLVRIPTARSLPWVACKPGLFISLATLLAELAKQLPVIVAAYWLSLEASGEVAFMTAVSQVMLLVSAAVSSNVNPIIAARWAHGRRETLLFEMSRIFRVMILSAPALFAGSIFAYYGLSVLVMPARYADLVLVFVGFALAASLRHALAWPGFMLVLMDRPELNALRVFITLCLSGLLLSSGAVQWHVNGLAIAVIGAACTQILLLHTFVKMGTEVNLLRLAGEAIAKSN